MKSYIFDADVACDVGVDCAVMYYNISYWTQKNQANEKHFYEGRYRTFNSTRAFAELFPFRTQKQVKRIIKTLEDKGYLLSGNFNKNSYDRTKWYTAIVPNGPTPIVPNGTTPLSQTVQPIPDVNTIENTIENKNQKKEFAQQVEREGVPSLSTICSSVVETDKKDPRTETVAPPKKESEEFFENWRKLYPRKTSKQGAKKKLISLLKRKVVTPDILLKGLEQYNKHIEKNNIDFQFIKHPTTRLNQGCWEDQLEQKKSIYDYLKEIHQDYEKFEQKYLPENEKLCKSVQFIYQQIADYARTTFGTVAKPEPELLGTKLDLQKIQYIVKDKLRRYTNC